MSTSVLNAYVAPSTRRHVFALSEELEKEALPALYMMQSSGGVIRAEMASSTPQTLMSVRSAEQSAPRDQPG
ncbi:MAG: hydantoinase/oxoprolinase family protein [[Clostridium] scindens]